jgi:hypothetical protein
MSANIDDQIEYAERLLVTAKRHAELIAVKKDQPRTVLRQMEKDQRTIEAIVETLTDVKRRGERSHDGLL